MLQAEPINNTVEELQKRLTYHFLTVKLGAAGQLVYYDKDFVYRDKEVPVMVLGIYTTNPVKYEEIAKRALETLPQDLSSTLLEQNIGFAVKMM